MKTGFIITAYKQIDLCINTIDMIRNSYGLLKESPIIIITTSEEDIGFKELEDTDDNIYIIEYKDAPPYIAVDYLGISNYGVQLSKRILLSLQKGLYKAKELNIDVCLHLHSDTYWQSDKIYNLIKYMQDVYDNKLLFSGDLSLDDKNSPISEGIHFEPEGLIININESIKYNFINFENIWSSKFRTHNFGSIEAMIGQFALWCLSGEYLLSKDIIPNIYKEKIRVRSTRPIHGVFEDGFVNQYTIQR